MDATEHDQVCAKAQITADAGVQNKLRDIMKVRTDEISALCQLNVMAFKEDLNNGKVTLHDIPSPDNYERLILAWMPPSGWQRARHATCAGITALTGMGATWNSCSECPILLTPSCDDDSNIDNLATLLGSIAESGKTGNGPDPERLREYAKGVVRMAAMWADRHNTCSTGNYICEHRIGNYATILAPASGPEFDPTNGPVFDLTDGSVIKHVRPVSSCETREASSVPRY